jgi:hypothetical protein
MRVLEENASIYYSDSSIILLVGGGVYTGVIKESGNSCGHETGGAASNHCRKGNLRKSLGLI